MDAERSVIGHSSSSFICSLGDDELIDFINKLSQDRKAKAKLEADASHVNNTDVATDVDTDPDDSHNQTDVDTEDDSQMNHKAICPSSPVAAAAKDDVKPESHREVVNLTSDEPASTSDGVLGSITLAQEKPLMETQVEELQFGDYETYFKEKKLKQAKADAEYKEWDENRRRKAGEDAFTYPPLFRNCTIYVNGRTDPDILQLHKLIVLHGGSFLHYLGAKGNATHIIASKLTPKKHIEFRNYKVVRPDWIVDSIAQRKLLPWMDYQIINVEFGQKKLQFVRPDNDDVTVDNSKDNNADEFVIAPPTQDEHAEEGDLFQKDNNFIDDGRIIDAKHPDFLKNFFSKSRLHHLSAWKSDLKFEFLQKAAQKYNSDGLTNRLNNPKPDFEKTIFHVDFDCFFATASALNNSRVDNTKDPIAVTHGGGNADIASCNYVARKHGVKNGMWVSQAKKLCPNLVCLDYNFDQYEKISRMFYDFLINLNCDSVLPVSVDEVLLDVTNLCHNDDEKIAELARNIREEIYERTRCTVSVGAASNVLLAKLSLRKSKPDGFFHLSNSDDVNEFLKDVLIRDLPGVGYSISNKLENELGLHDIKVGTLKKVDQEKLINLFGIKTGTKLYEYARGIDNTDINISSNLADFTRKSVSIDVNWGIRFDNIAQVDQFLLNCAKEMHSRLLKIKMVGSSVTLKLARRAPSAPIDPPKYMGMGKCDFVTKSARFGIGTREIGLISSECKSIYRILNIPPEELRGVSIQITHLVDDASMEKQLRNQRKLPFSTMNKTQFLAEAAATKAFNKDIDKKVNNNNVVVIDSSPVVMRSQPKSDDSRQYEVPSDVDSSVLRALPDEIREAIEKKKAKRNVPVVPIPAQSQIDWDVFKALPKEIQAELKSELERREIPVFNKPSEIESTSRLKKKSPKGKFHMQPVFSRHENEPKAVRVISPSKKAYSPRKRIKSRGGSPVAVNLEDLDIDEDVLDELPSFVRRNLIADLKGQRQIQNDRILEKELFDKLEFEIDNDLNQTKPKRKIQLTRTLFNEITNYDQNKPKFLQYDCFKDVKKELIEWVSTTIRSGPNDDEMIAFIIFITNLLENSISNCINYLKIINSTICIESSILNLSDKDEGVVTWRKMVENVKGIIDDKCFEKHITYNIND